MIKYEMIVDGERYCAVFANNRDRVNFFYSNAVDGTPVEVLKISEVTPAEILTDADFSHSYAVEVVAFALFGDGIKHKSVVECEKMLIDCGILR